MNHWSGLNFRMLSKHAIGDTKLVFSGPFPTFIQALANHDTFLVLKSSPSQWRDTSANLPPSETTLRLWPVPSWIIQRFKTTLWFPCHNVSFCSLWLHSPYWCFRVTMCLSRCSFWLHSPLCGFYITMCHGFFGCIRHNMVISISHCVMLFTLAVFIIWRFLINSVSCCSLWLYWPYSGCLFRNVSCCSLWLFSP